ncbi:hypothetical protein E2C01_025626 [Portunus trituberculatus]|uniref:Uncharacterized protein n=1 Tax=Portunus trituberculatus TaxID=210409 RepID=A0A5B7EGE5_PORTR|nr:hypothetical protein [Portunus trituberculatus]
MQQQVVPRKRGGNINSWRRPLETSSRLRMPQLTTSSLNTSTLSFSISHPTAFPSEPEGMWVTKFHCEQTFVVINGKTGSKTKPDCVPEGRQ